MTHGEQTIADTSRASEITEARDLWHGVAVDGYQVSRRIARTAGSEVLRAISRETGEEVALKVPRTPMAAETIRHEADVHRAIGRRPFIVDMVESGTVQDMPFIVTRLQENGTMTDAVYRSGSVFRPPADDRDLQRRIRLLQHAAMGVGALHAAGFVHRDIKLANIGVDRTSTGRLIDLGVAETLHTKPAVDRIWGTPGESIAPEGYRGDISQEGDVWAHALTAYRTLVGVSAFDAPEEKTVFGYFHHASKGPKRTPRDIDDRIPSDVDRVIFEALNPDPRKRPTIDEVQDVYGKAA